MTKHSYKANTIEEARKLRDVAMNEYLKNCPPVRIEHQNEKVRLIGQNVRIQFRAETFRVPITNKIGVGIVA